MRRLLLLLALFAGTVAFAQDATPTPLPTDETEATSQAEMTPEMTEMVDVTDACPVLVAEALELTETNCEGTILNEACYGYTFIDAVLRNLDTNFVQPGDIADVIDIQSLQLSAMDVVSGLWGLMVMSVEANTGDGNVLTGEDVQIVLFGDTNLQDASQFVQVTANNDLTIFSQPDANSEIVQTIAADESVIANSRLEDDTWLRVRIVTEGTAQIGWLQAEQVSAATNLDVLPTLTAEQAAEPPSDLAAQYGPMQAFIFESGENDAPCSEAPNSGMLIQTPEGAASVTLWLDEVVVQLDGTGVVSAQANGDLTVGVIAGEATVEANGESSTAVTGEAIDVPLDENLAADGTPSEARPITDDEVQALPVTLLDDLVDLPNNATPAGSTIPSGEAWAFAYTTEEPFICSDGSEVESISAGINGIITVQSDSLTLSGLRFSETTAGVYAASYADSVGNFIQDTLRVVSPTVIAGDRTIDLITPPCTLTLSFVLTRVE